MCCLPTRRRVSGFIRQPAAAVFTVACVLAWGSSASAQPTAVAGPTQMRGVVQHAGEGLLPAAVRHGAARLVHDAAPLPQTATQQRRSWIRRHPVIAGKLIGTGAGAALSRIDALGGANHDPRVALIGTGAGAWGGLIASAVQKARSKEKVGVGTKIGIAGGAVGLVVLPVLACYGAGGCGGFS
jgi:hypothetical protein